MNESLVLTVIGPDRPGIVDRVASLVLEAGGSWRESRMAQLAGHFAGILHVTTPTERVAVLRSALVELQAEGLTVVVAAEPCEGGDANGQALALSVAGQDRPGIVQSISRTLAANGINVVALETEVVNAPWSGEPMFSARATLQAGPATDIDAIRTSLEGLANDLMVELELARPDADAPR